MKCEFLLAVGCALFLPAVGPLFLPAVGPLFWLITVMFAESAGFTHGLVGAAAGCLTLLFVRHALRDVLIAFRELLPGGDLFAQVCHAPARAARGLLD